MSINLRIITNKWKTYAWIKITYLTLLCTILPVLPAIQHVFWELLVPGQHVRHLKVIFPSTQWGKKMSINWKRHHCSSFAENCSQRAKCWPPPTPNWRGRHANTGNYNSPGWELPGEPVWHRKTYNVNGELLEAQCGQIWELKTCSGLVLWELWHFCEFSL